MRRAGLFLTAVLLFMGSCGALVPAAMRLADPMTRRPLASGVRPFPLLVVTGETARVERVEDVARLPPAPAGSTYLVPREKAQAFQEQLRTSGPGPDGDWTLRVDDVAPGRQRIELVWIGDGFWGGVYEATPTTVVPLYRKLTGPGFAFVVVPLALALNVTAWGLLWLLYRVWKRSHRARSS